MGDTERARGAEVVQFDQAAYQALHRRFDQLQATVGRQTDFFAAFARSVAELQRSVGELQRDMGALRADVSELRSSDALNQMHFDAARAELAAARREIAEAGSAMREMLDRMPMPGHGTSGQPPEF
jgi:chromosome segregation ATPase